MNEFFTAVLNVLAVLALIGVGAFIIVFISDLVISIIDGKKGIFFRRKEKGKTKELEMGDELEKDLRLDYKEEKKVEKLGGDIDLDKAEQERLLISGKANKDNNLKERIQLVDNKSEYDVEDKVEELTDKDEEVSDQELDAMYAQLIADINKQADEEMEEVKEPEHKEEEPAVEEKKAETRFSLDDFEDEDDENDEKLRDLEEQVEELRKLLATQQTEKTRLQEELKNRPAVAVESGEMESLDGLLTRKTLLEDRLKVAEKELKQNKKEYQPLARIKRTLENDQSKLRRREAIVAKQKIMLFGVTNYVVDPEKEKRLADELDTLEALRLSVQHCEEVMRQNADRYPILQKTNQILVKNVETVKEDIAAIDAKILAVKAKQAK